MKMKKRTLILNFALLITIVVTLIGCEAGLTSKDSATDSEGNEASGFSFSDMYSDISDLKTNNNKLSSNLDSSTDELQRNIDALTESIRNTLVPVGTIVAWHKSLENVTIPEGWVECDGEIITDSESPYNNLNAPDLNNPKNSWNSKGSFLRGGTTSGVFEDGMNQRHSHSYSIFRLEGRGTYDTGDSYFALANAILQGRTTAVSGGDETRPVNMSVVYIMRIK